MFYSLKSRFKGCLIGAYLGLKLAEDEQTEGIFSLIFEIGNSLINNSNSWWEFSPNSLDVALKRNNERNKESSKLALILLPIILSYHDNLWELNEQLETILSKLESSEETKENLTIWAKFISLICTEIKPENLITEILTNHKLAENLLIKQLKIVDKYRKEGRSLRELVKELTKQKYSEELDLALAIYCFICTPEEFNLTIKRAKIVTNYQDKIILGLTGALSGVYNSYDGEKIELPEIYLLAEKLFMRWCGVYDMKQNQIFNPVNVANINLIQHRN